MLNRLITKNWDGGSSGAISVEGLDNAMALAKMLIKNNYQVVIAEDDCDIFVIAYSENAEWNDSSFALITDDEAAQLEMDREAAKDDNGEDEDNDDEDEDEENYD